MHTATVEIFSDRTNAAVMRHPERKFPGVLIHGDSLYALCYQADVACEATKAESGASSEAYAQLNELRNSLWSYLNHYKVVLGEHQIPLPFSQEPAAFPADSPARLDSLPPR